MRSQGGKVGLGWIVEWLKTFGKSDGLGIQGQARNEAATAWRSRKLIATPLRRDGRRACGAECARLESTGNAFPVHSLRIPFPRQVEESIEPIRKFRFEGGFGWYSKQLPNRVIKVRLEANPSQRRPTHRMCKFMKHQRLTDFVLTKSRRIITSPPSII
jgi:hypothetical protein